MLVVLFFTNSISVEYKMIFFTISMLVASPIGIYQYLSDENPIQHGEIFSFTICFGEFFLLGLALFLWLYVI